MMPPSKSLLRIVLAVLLGGAIGGCIAGTPRDAHPATLTPKPPAAATLTADWNDLGAAVAVGLRNTGLQVVASQTPDARTRGWSLRNRRGEPGSITATRQTLGDARGDDAQIRLEVQVGRFGRPAEADAALRGIVRRLEQLRGVETAPVR